MRRAAAALAALLAAAPAGAQQATHGPIPDDLWQAMQGTSWHADLPCPARETLSLLSVPFRDYDGAVRTGQLVVARDVAADVAGVFDTLFADESLRIRQMVEISAFGGDDDLSMAADNTSAFNCRLVAGTDRLSEHAKGLAIDINPARNPFVRGASTSPSPEGKPFDTPAERAAAVAAGTPGLIVADDATVRAFAGIGWGWGGTWSSSKDFQHFSQSGN